MKMSIVLAGLCALLLLPVPGRSCKPYQSLNEQELNRYSPDIIGPADTYLSHIYFYDLSYDFERFNYNGVEADVQITGYGVRPRVGPAINQLNVLARHVNFNFHPFILHRIGRTTFSARVTSEDVDVFLNQQASTVFRCVHDVHMAFTPQQVILTATIDLDGCPQSLVATGTLQTDGPARVIFVPCTFNIALSAEMQQDIQRYLNPVVDMSSLNIKPQIGEICLGNCDVIINGKATLNCGSFRAL